MTTTPTERDTSPGRLRWLGLFAFPLMVAALLVWAVGGLSLGGSAPIAAVVNNDRPVTIQGELVPLGRQLAGLLVDGSNDDFRWVLTSAKDAEQGLADGDYTAVVTVPPSFSERATSAAASNDATKAAQGLVTVDMARDSAVTDAAVARHVVQAATTTLNAQVVETYLDNVYLGFNTLHDELGKAADGSAQLADGTKEANAGAKHLADGLSDASKQTKDLPTQTRQLATGARQVADGNRQLATTVVPVANAALRGIDALPSLGTSVEQLAQLTDDCPALIYRDFCARLDTASGSVSAQSTQLTQRRGNLRGQIVEVRDGVTRLAEGSEQVADGTAQLADAAIQLTDGLAEASTGAQQLADGTAQLDTGMTTLSVGLAGARTEIPTFTASERTRLAKAVATPALVAGGSTATARLAGSFFLVLALWLGGLATFLARRPVPSALASARSTGELVLAATRPGALVAFATGLTLGTGMAFHLQLPWGRSLGLVGITALAALVFALVNQALAALLGNAGRAVALGAVLVTAVVGITSTSPSTLASLARLLPTHDAGTALRAVTLGGDGLAGATLSLVAWGLAALIGTAWAIERQRTLSPRQLRPLAAT